MVSVEGLLLRRVRGWEGWSGVAGDGEAEMEGEKLGASEKKGTFRCISDETRQ